MQQRLPPAAQEQRPQHRRQRQRRQRAPHGTRPDLRSCASISPSTTSPPAPSIPARSFSSSTQIAAGSRQRDMHDHQRHRNCQHRRPENTGSANRYASTTAPAAPALKITATMPDDDPAWRWLSQRQQHPDRRSGSCRCNRERQLRIAPQRHQHRNRAGQHQKRHQHLRRHRAAERGGQRGVPGSLRQPGGNCAMHGHSSPRAGACSPACASLCRDDRLNADRCTAAARDSARASRRPPADADSATWCR